MPLKCLLIIWTFFSRLQQSHVAKMLYLPLYTALICKQGNLSIIHSNISVFSLLHLGGRNKRKPRFRMSKLSLFIFFIFVYIVLVLLFCYWLSRDTLCMQVAVFVTLPICHLFIGMFTSATQFLYHIWSVHSGHYQNVPGCTIFTNETHFAMKWLFNIFLYYLFSCQPVPECIIGHKLCTWWKAVTLKS